MKILNAEQIRKADSYTIENEPIASIDLMERASKECFLWIKKHIKKDKKIFVFCGMGNNGGDGLAIARMLRSTGYNVFLYKVLHKDEASEDFIINEKRLKKIKGFKIYDINNIDDFPETNKDDIIIDALLGSGLNSPLRGLLADVVRQINLTEGKIISIDFPSGLFCEDNSSNKADLVVHATHTLSFQVPKLSFFFAENEKFTGLWHILDIGLNQEFINEQETAFYYTLPQMIKPIYRPRKVFSHKGDYGHALLLAGSKGKSGAAVLSAKAAVKSGVGLMSISLPGSCYLPVQVNVPEAMCIADNDENIIQELVDISKFSVVGAGPGIGVGKQTQNVIKLLIQNSSAPLVLDADAINILSENPTWLSFLPKSSILTPHPGEMDRLAGKSASAFERLDKAREYAFKYGIYIVLKGAYTSIICPDRKVFFNSTANPGMATGGSGDVLTGVILAWLAQGYSPFESALIGVYLHGLSGDIAARKLSFEAMSATDIINNIWKAIRKTFY
ncbi:MAG: NAD(P)H-hydrate dehydratase [Bacteroidota bacterium]